MSELYSQPFVFLSYAHADEVFVMRLKADLQARGIPIWIDREGILPGTPDWEHTIRTAIRTANAVLLVASPHARSAQVVQDELAVARMYQCHIYPLWIAGTHWIDAIPLGMGRIQYIDAREIRYEGAINELAAKLKSALSAHRTKALHPHDQESSQTASSHSVLQIGRRQQHPLIGRDREMKVLRGFLLETEECGHLPQMEHTAALDLFPNTPSRSLCVVLLGDAGIGKTRLAEEINREAQRRRWTVVGSRSNAQENNIPYRLWTEVMRQVMTQGIAPQSEVSQHPLRYQPLTTLFSEFAVLLPQNIVPPAPTSEQGRYQLWEAMLALLIAISKFKPLLLILDDLHWIDSSSAELLAFLVRRLQRHPVLLLGTCRKSEVSATHSLHILFKYLQREQLLVTLSVSPLSDEQIGALVTHVTIHLARQIQRQAAGNPFIAEELAHIASFEGSSTLAIPETITALLDLRLGILSGACQQLLSNAAVLGGSFTFNIIQQMEVGINANASEDTILDLLEEAIQAGVITEEGTSTRINYQFWHPLLVSHLYDQLSAVRRARLHRRAAQVLQEVYQGHEEEGAAMIVNHLVAGGAEPLQVVHYAALAGDRSYNLSAYPEAEGFYRIAVAQLDEHIGPLLGNATPDERSQLAYFLEKLGECTRVQGNYEEARHLYERVLAVRSYQRTYTSTIEYQYQAQIDALLWREIALTWYDVGDSQHAQECCERGEQVLREAEVVGGAAWAILRFQESYICWRQGNYVVASDKAHEAMKLLGESLQQQKSSQINDSYITGTKRTLAGDPVNLGRTYTLLGTIANSVGEHAETLNHLNTALAIFEQFDRQREIANVSCDIGYVYLNNAEHELSQAFLRRSLNLSERVGDVPLMAVVLYNLGELSLHRGDLAEAEALFRRGLEFAEQVNDQVYVSLWNATLAIVLQDQGKSQDATVCIRRSLANARIMNNMPCIGYALMTLGNMRIVQVRLVDTKQSYTEKEKNKSNDSKQVSLVTSNRYLLHTKETLKRVLALQELEVETRTEGKLALAKVLLFLGEHDQSQQQAYATLKDAEQYKLMWIFTRTQQLLGNILAAQGQMEQATKCFVEAIDVFRQCGMHLELARTLHSYGIALLKYTGMEQKNYQQGLSYLAEAHKVFDKCGAVLDSQLIEHDIAMYKDRKEI